MCKKLFIPLLITHIYEKDKDLFQTSNKLLYMAYHICIICSIVFLFYRKSKILELKTYQQFFQPVIYPVVLQLRYGSDTQILLELWFLHIMSKMQLSSSLGQTDWINKWKMSPPIFLNIFCLLDEYMNELWIWSEKEMIYNIILFLRWYRFDICCDLNFFYQIKKWLYQYVF